MEHLIIKAKSVKVPEAYKIEVTFDDNLVKIIDLESILHGPLYGPLKTPQLFDSVRIDEETGVVQWSNGADFDPSTLYEWEKHAHELSKRALEW